jgi:DNA polymerase III epsilon subunit family exonuclease
MAVLRNSMFQEILFPGDADEAFGSQGQLYLQKVLRHHLSPESIVANFPIVIFDFETTGLDVYRDRIIEIGAIKYVGGQRVGEFSYLIDPETPLPEVIVKITGITPEMLQGKPKIESVLPEFLHFIDKSVLVAHNAEFDLNFLRSVASRQGYQIEYPCFCTLKMARLLLPDLESKNLDTLAKHYELSFAARHRSIGDCEVTGSVLTKLLEKEGLHMQRWRDFEAVQVI